MKRLRKEVRTCIGKGLLTLGRRLYALGQMPSNEETRLTGVDAREFFDFFVNKEALVCDKAERLTL